jgi:hypothetical protein
MRLKTELQLLIFNRRTISVLEDNIKETISEYSNIHYARGGSMREYLPYGMNPYDLTRWPRACIGFREGKKW